MDQNIVRYRAGRGATRRFCASILGAALLGACGAPSPTNGNVAMATGSNSGDSVANDATRPEPAAAAAAIPAALHGLYDQDRASCAEDASQYRLRVSAGELRYHESIGTVRAVTAGADGAISVAADWQGEGESWSNVRTISLSPDGILTISGEGVTTTRIRCP